jgi:phosphoribosylaminoimidazolecarboxamide formyltransferase/IMP cyclohydrolase
MKIERALLSVWDKTGLVEFAKGLLEMDVQLLSTGGTARALREAKLPVTDVGEVTGFPEMLDGRVKTLHPKIHGGLLFRRDLDEHRAEALRHGIHSIDLVAVNLYPFEQTIGKPGVTEEQAVEQIDIGGPSMIRSAAKNHHAVTVVTDPADYPDLLAEMRENGGDTILATRLRLAQKVFALTGRYDSAIAAWLAETAKMEPAPSFSVHGLLRQELRYGENPHQKAAFYAAARPVVPSIASARQLSGKELSFNNILDASAVLDLVRSFDTSAVAIVKHNNPCGAAEHEDLLEAFQLAWAGDPLSAFGGIVGLNRPLPAALAEQIAAPGRFVEVIVAPAFAPDAVEILTTKPKWGKNVRLLEVGPLAAAEPLDKDVRVLSGGLLVQDRDLSAESAAAWQVVTKRSPTEAERASLRFAWNVCRCVKSNAIVFAKEQAVVGVGAGQMSRVDSVELAARKSGKRAAGAVMASDAFFPFPDGVETAAEAGITAVIQPGGSVKDDAVIAACNRANLAMVFTGIRHFRH